MIAETTSTAPLEVRRARAGLLRCTEPPAPVVSRFVDARGVVGAWEAVKTGRAPARAEIPTWVADCSPAQLEDQIDQDFDAATGAGARLVVPEDDEWPDAALINLSQAHINGTVGAVPPLALYVRGAPLADFPAEAVTIVGSRANTPYGSRIATDLAFELAGDGWSIVSGAAFGIDTCAHRAALASDHPRPTVAVLACGIERAYPAANTELLQKISERGTVVSEYSPGSVPAKHRFLVRNRLIAALGAGTIVVEAGRRSGTLSTAAAARAQHRIVMAVPGPVTSALSVGCHLLIAERDAQLISSAADVKHILRPAGQPALFESASRSDSGGAPDDMGDLDDETGRIHRALAAKRSTTVTEIARITGLSSADVLAGLGLLDLAGLATRTSTGWRKAAAGARR